MSIRIEATADRQFGTNSYLVEDQDTKDAVIIDATSNQGLIPRREREAFLVMHATDIEPRRRDPR